MNNNYTKMKVVDLNNQPIDHCQVSTNLININSIFNAVLYKEVKVFGEDVLRRQFSASVKNKSMVSGSGKKRRPQKRTGRARMRTNRAPHFRGGAVAFAPANARNVSLPIINRKKRRKVIAMLLSEHYKNNSLHVIDQLKFDHISTVNFINIFENNFQIIKRKFLIIDEREYDQNFYLSQRNYFYSKLINLHQISATNLSFNYNIIISQKSLLAMDKIYCQDILQEGEGK